MVTGNLWRCNSICYYVAYDEDSFVANDYIEIYTLDSTYTLNGSMDVSNLKVHGETYTLPPA